MTESLRSLRLSRRGLLGTGAALGVGTVLSACADRPTSSPPAPTAELAEGAYDGRRVVLEFWNGFTGDDGAVMQRLVQAFNREHDTIEVRMTAVEWSDFYAGIQDAVADGAGPDVAAVHAHQVATIAARNVVLPLDEFVGAMGLQEDDVPEPVWAAGTYDGTRYAIPLDVHPLGLYANTELLARAGIDEVPSDRETWTTALDALREDGVEHPFWVTAGEPASLVFTSLLAQFGGSLYDEETVEATFASDAGVEALTWYANHVEQGYSPPDVPDDAVAQAFRQGRTALVVDGVWAAGAWDGTPGLDWTAAPVPVIGEQPAVWAGSHQLVVLQQRRPDEDRLHAARDFLAYLSEQSLEWARAGQVPARSSVRERAAFGELETQQTLAEQLEDIVLFPPVPGIGDLPAATFGRAVRAVLLGEAEPRAALEQAQDRADALLADNRRTYSS